MESIPSMKKHQTRGKVFMENEKLVKINLKTQFLIQRMSRTIIYNILKASIRKEHNCLYKKIRQIKTD